MESDSKTQPPRVPLHIDARLLARIVHNFPNGSVNIFDRELRYLFAEGRGLREVGLSTEQLVGKSLHELFPKEIADYAAAYYKRALAGEHVEFELSFRGHYYTISASPLADSKGYIHATVAVATDITEYRRFENLRDRFLSLAAHDLKSPLSAIRNIALAYLRRPHASGTDYNEIRASFMNIEMAAGDMINQINHFLRDTNLRTGGISPVDAGPVDLIGVVQAQIKRHSGINPDHQFEMRSDITRLIGNWDRQRIELMLANLLSNAIKFSPDGGTISIRLTREDHLDGVCAIVTVTDSGIGIPEAELEHVFELSYRASNVVGRFDGTGNGLAGVREIVREHGGTISVQSHEGSGSTFTVRLPLASGETNQ